MNNFGVIEVASAKTTSAPGWAYVPDRQPHHIPPSATTAPSNRKRARTAASGGVQLSLADASARQEAKARREIEILDRDNARDVQIAIPAKSGGARPGGRKYTPNVRKILQSQKTFANHLDDYIALQSQQAESTANTNTNPASNNNNNGGGSSGGTPAANPSTTRSGQRQGSTSTSTSTKKSRAKTLEPDDVEMLETRPTSASAETSPQTTRKSAILTPHSLPPAHPEDANPLLSSRLPLIPSDDELRALLAAPPLSYLEARGTWPPSGSGGDQQQQQQQYPTRVFCAVCGYWGRVRCMKCGTRVCALECLETHQEECITRYGL